MSKIRALSQRKKVILGALTLMLILVFAISIYAIADSPYEDGQVHAEKEALSNGDGTYKVTINVTGEPFSTGEEAGLYDVVLVIDRSTSMSMYDMPGSSQSRLDAAKTAAKSFVDTILGDDANDGNRVALVSFGTDGQQVQDFTDNIATLKSAINGLNTGGTQYTNIQEGLIYARNYIDNDDNDDAKKIVVLLSDGAPTRSVSDLYWDDEDGYYTGYGWNRKWHDNPYYTYLERAEMGESVYPSSYDNEGSGTSSYDRYFDRIIVEANKIRALGADIYSVGIDADDNMKKALGAADKTFRFSRNNGVAAWENGSTIYEISYPYNGQATNGGGYLIPDFDDFKVDYATAYYTTNDADELEEIFEGFLQEFSTVATEGVLTDVLPEYFDIDIPDGASQNGDVYTWTTGPNTITYNTVTRTITWNVGSIGLTKTLTYTVTPVAGYWGDGYTNATTNLTATAVDDNPEYISTGGAVDIDILSPERFDDGVVGDKYTGTDDIVNGVDRKTPINIPGEYLQVVIDGVMDNDTVTSLKYVFHGPIMAAHMIAAQKVWIKTVRCPALSNKRNQL